MTYLVCYYHQQLIQLALHLWNINKPWTWSMDHIFGPSPWTSSWIRSIDYPVDHPQFLKMNFTREVLTNFRNLKWTLCCGQVMGSLYFTLFFIQQHFISYLHTKEKFTKIVENQKKCSKITVYTIALKKGKKQTNKQTKRQTT